MATITLNYNATNSIAKSLIQAIKQSGVFKIQEPTHYDKEFVKQIENNRTGRRKAIKTADLWK